MNLLQKYISSLKENKEGLSPGFIAAVSLLVLFTACLPLFTVNCIQGHDISYHLLRMEALKTGMENGLPFLRINLLFFGGEGYASSLFYPDFLLYIPAFLRFIGVGINLSWHIFVALCIILAFGTVYFSVFYITDQHTSALIAALVFTLCRYHLDDIYTRAAVGEFSAMIFLPLVIAGLFDLTEKEFKKPWILTAGMAGVLLCHTLSFGFSLILCILAVILRIRVFVKDPARFGKLLITAVFTACLTAFYWIPMLEMLSAAPLRCSDPIFDLSYEKLLLKDIFASTPGRMGAALFILLLPALIVEHKEDRSVKTADILTIIGVIFALFTTGVFPWERAERYLSFIQFPWRLFIVSSLLLSIGAGIYISKIRGALSRVLILISAAFMLFTGIGVINGIDTGYYSYSHDYFNEVKFTDTVIGAEWLPKAVTDRSLLTKDTDTAFDEKGNGIPVTRKGNALIFNASGEEYADVPFIYYKGYSASRPDGTELRTDGSGSNGRVRVYDPGSGEVRVFYKGTLLQRISDIISLLSFALVPVFIIFTIRKERSK